MFACVFLMNFQTMLLNSNSIHPITTKLLYWYSNNKRDLPWRDNPEPYSTWLSEIVFQQTRIDQGLDYYVRLKAKYPTVYDLAKADEREVLKVWEGLGYYSRARNLHHTAKTIVDKFDGKFPEKYEDILSLKGVGPYTAAAIASIAFSISVPAIDGNVLRVSSRLFTIKEPIDKRSTWKTIEKQLLDIIDSEHPGDFNQAMMELGSLICKPQNPQCEHCPVSDHCTAYHSGIQNELPVKAKKVAVKNVFYNFLVINNEDKLLITQRKEGIWKEMYQFPLFESDAIYKESEIIKIVEKLSIKPIYAIMGSSEYKHVLSHRKIYAKFWMIKTTKELSGNNAIAIDKKDLVNYPMPRLIRRFLESDEAIQFFM